MARSLTLKDHHREIGLFKHRLVVAALIIALLVIGLFSRLVYLQVIKHPLYTTLSQQNRLDLLPIAPNRGLIYDRNGVLLAENIPVFSLEVIPARVKDLAKTLEDLGAEFTLTPEDVKAFKHQMRQHRPFEPVPLLLKLTPKQVAQFYVNQYRFKGVVVTANLIRHYLDGSALANVLGYVGRINQKELRRIDTVQYSATNFIGKVGIEKHYEKMLHGRIGYQQVEMDANGRVIRTLSKTPPLAGQNLFLTVDSGMQKAAEKALGELRGAVVAIQPNTGEVLTMVSAPSYDPNVFIRGISRKDYAKLQNSNDNPLFNRCLRGQFSLGSTIKPILALEGLDTNTITPSEKIYDPGWFKLRNSDHVFKDWAAHGHVDLIKAITVSCDTYFYKLAVKLGIDKIDNIMARFGFGHLTGIDMNEELPGLVPSPAWKIKNKGQRWYAGDTVISGIGQGAMLATPLQLANATAILANRGGHFQPRLLHATSYTNDPAIFSVSLPTPRVELINAGDWDLVTEGMEAVIRNKHGTGYRFGRNPPYTVAAKTGTAQLYGIKHGDNYNEADIPKRLRDNTLFIAFAPVDHPEIALAVVTENSNQAPRVARKVMDYYFAHRIPIHNQEAPKS